MGTRSSPKVEKSPIRAGKLQAAVGDGALGFWKVIEEVFPGTRHKRCWVHKTANVLNKVALSVQVNIKADLREIYGAPTRAAAEAAIDVFVDKSGANTRRRSPA